MIRNYLTCPRCGGEWQEGIDWRQKCGGGCGLAKTHYYDLVGEAYYVDVGNYGLYWAFWGNSDDQFSIEHIVDGIGQGLVPMEPLPFDVSEDALKLYMVFS